MSNLSHRRSLLRLCAALCALVSVCAAARADEQLVYWPLVTDGSEYRRVTYPNEAGALQVLADTVIILEAVRAPVSYWPITREYLADLSRQQPVQGQLEVVDESGQVTAVRPQPYLVWHPEGVGAGPAEVIHGDRVAAFYEDYVQRARSAAALAAEYQRVVAEQHAAVEAWLRIAAQRPDTLPTPPPELAIKEPEPYRAFATEPAQGLVLSLPQGTYTIRLRAADGGIVPGSERELISFAAMDTGIGYVVRPGDRWTQPSLSFAPTDMIYTIGGADLFIQPVPVAQYEARPFSRLLRPQSIEVADDSLTLWVLAKEGTAHATGVSLAIEGGDGAPRTLPLTPYRVAQVAGTSRGYEIKEFAPEAQTALQPDFFAMRIERGAASVTISLRHDGQEAPMPASTRRILRVDPAPGHWLFTVALLPLAFGIALRAASRRGDARRRAWRLAGEQ